TERERRKVAGKGEGERRQEDVGPVVAVFHRLRWLLVATIVSIGSFAAVAQGLPVASRPEEVGMSSGRLKRITETLMAEIEKGTMPGAVLLVARNGKVAYFEAMGVRDPVSGEAMQRDAIFRLASMTKPFVSVAVMMLAEEGKLVLTDPVSRFLPEMKGLQVGVEQREADGAMKLAMEPARREMTVQDLLRHTAGLTYGQFGPRTLVKTAYLDAAISSAELTGAEFVGRLAKLPLAHQPGTTWDYSVAVDVLGHLVEVVSGHDLDTFIRERISKPLRLQDTGFFVTGPGARRIAESYADKATGQRLVLRNVFQRPNRFGGGG